MKRKAAKIIALAVCLVLSLSLFSVTSSAATDVTGKLTNLKPTYQSGLYWNHAPGSANSPSSVRSSGCTHHDNCNTSTGSCGCNFFGRGIQCHGFALYMANLVYGSYPNADTSMSSYNSGDIVNGNWTFYKARNISSLLPGDIIRGQGHTAIVWSVSGSIVNVAEVWGGHDCKISWGGFNYSITNMSELISNLIYVVRNDESTTVTVTFNANGGRTPVSSKSVTVGNTYGSLPTPTKSGYRFTGWFNAEGNRIYSSSVVTKSSNHTLYAHWSKNSYK